MLKNLLLKIREYLYFPIAPQTMKKGVLEKNPNNGRRPLIGRLDRYIIYKFISTYLFLIAIIIVIAVIFDFNENIDKLTQSHA